MTGPLTPVVAAPPTGAQALGWGRPLASLLTPVCMVSLQTAGVDLVVKTVPIPDTSDSVVSAQPTPAQLRPRAQVLSWEDQCRDWAQIT